jgi:hypothetical protein
VGRQWIKEVPSSSNINLYDNNDFINVNMENYNSKLFKNSNKNFNENSWNIIIFDVNSTVYIIILQLVTIVIVVKK